MIVDYKPSVIRTAILKVNISNHSNPDCNGEWYLCHEYDVYDTYVTGVFSKSKSRAKTLGVLPDSISDSDIKEIAENYSVCDGIDYIDLEDENGKCIKTIMTECLPKECVIEYKIIVVVRAVLDSDIYELKLNK